ncbi:MAG: VWA domain-containing protein [Candidatus Limnocylindria bacterium]
MNAGPVEFTDPAWLWLLVPALAVVVGAWLAAGRTLPRGRRIASLVLRVAIVAAVAASLAGARLALPADRLAVVFLVDRSASMLDATSEELFDYARRAVREMPEGDLAGVVVFGGDALVDRLPGDARDLQRPSSVPVAAASDIGGAIRLASALFPAGMQQRLVLLSDGNDTSGDATRAALAAAAASVRLDVVVPADETYGEVLVDSVEAPEGARVGETIDVEVLVRATISTTATVRLLADGATVATRTLELETGDTSVPFSVEADEAGFHVFTAVVEPSDDHFAENNAGDAYVLVRGEPQVLVATDDAARAADLVDALAAARQDVTVVPTTGVPSSIATLAGYDAVVLDNVPSDALGTEAMTALQVFVRDLGRGLVMIGGDNSYSAGGYLGTPMEETLPVYMTVRDRERSPDVALVAVVDKSGSMADCHCTGDDRQQAFPQTRGFEKVDIAKEAILRAADALAPSDQLGVVAFDSAAHWAVRTGPLDVGAIQDSLGFAAEGQTNIYAGVRAAYEDLVDNPAALRHIILITDGWSNSGVYDQLLADLREAGITLSTIGTGGGSADILRELAEKSGGRYYDAGDATQIPNIFLRETLQTAGEKIVEEVFQPIPSAASEILRGLDVTRLPALRGYNATTAKGTATVALLSHHDDPVLAQWQYGLGRSVAWMSDTRQHWATDWIGTATFGTFAAQLVAWTLPPADEQGITATFTPRGDGSVAVDVESLDDDGAPRNFFRSLIRVVGPSLDPQQSELQQTGAGRYAGTIQVEESGAYLVRISQTRDGEPAASRTLGLVNPAAAEFRRLGVDAEALGELARAALGRELDTDAPEEVWRHDIPADAFPGPIWPWLLVLAFVLFPVDVGVRRVAITRGDLARARGWLARRVGLARPLPAPTPGLAELMAAKQRVERRVLRSGPDGGSTPTAPAPSPAQDPRAPSESRPAPEGPPSPAAAAAVSDALTADGETLAERLARRRRERS